MLRICTWEKDCSAVCDIAEDAVQEKERSGISSYYNEGRPKEGGVTYLKQNIIKLNP